MNISHTAVIIPAAATAPNLKLNGKSLASMILVMHHSASIRYFSTLTIKEAS